MKIETERLLLREMSDHDFDSLYKILEDSDIMKLQLRSEIGLSIILHLI